MQQRLIVCVASVGMAVGMASCGENAPAPPPASSAGASGPGLPGKLTQGPVAQPNAQPNAAGSQGRAHSDAPVPPKDAQWTILCDVVQGPGHVENARDLKDMLVKRSGLNDFYIIHGEQDSTVYYGFYRSLDDPRERARADGDRARLGSLTDRLKNRLIRGGVLVAVVPPDPPAPADWNLLNTPRNAYWTIEIATFAGHPKRKEAAVELVRQLRQSGETGAYFYHGPTASSVCIGAWPRDAVAEQGTGIDANGKMRDDAHATSPDEPLIVFGDVLPPNIPKDVREPGTGKRMIVEGNRLDIVDPALKQKTKEYPTHSTNYEVRGSSNGTQVFPDPSVLVVIPHEQQTPAGSGAGDDWRLTGGLPPAGPAPVAAHPPGSATDDPLRSIGDR